MTWKTPWILLSILGLASPIYAEGTISGFGEVSLMIKGKDSEDKAKTVPINIKGLVFIFFIRSFSRPSICQT